MDEETAAELGWNGPCLAGNSLLAASDVFHLSSRSLSHSTHPILVWPEGNEKGTERDE